MWVSECYQSLTAHQHQKGHTVPKQVIMKCYSLSTALGESIRYQAKSEQNVRQDLIPRVRHGETALCTPISMWDVKDTIEVCLGFRTSKLIPGLD